MAYTGELIGIDYIFQQTGKPLDEVDVEHFVGEDLEVKDEDENEEDTDIPPIYEGNLHYPGAKVDVKRHRITHKY